MADAGCSENLTTIPEFLLLGFQVLPELKHFLFLMFLTLFLLTVGGNMLIVVTVSVDKLLHSPMYFFLGNFSFLEIWYTTTTVSTLLGGLWTEGISISLPSCITQFHLFGWLTAAECFLLTIMAYDRYVAICHPLHYTSLMERMSCFKMVISAWMASLVLQSFATIFLSRLKFSGQKEIDHFFCDLTPILKTSCSDTSLVEIEILAMSIFVLPIPLLLITVSYAYIITTILRIPSATGRHRAFSTCSSHLAVVITYFGTMIAVYVVPMTYPSLNLNKATSLLYSVATPMVNPIIYALRNKAIRKALRKAFHRKCS